MSLKNFIMRKGKTSSVELGEGAKEEGGEGKEEEGGDTAAKEGEEPAVAGEAVPAAAAETNEAPASAEQAADEAAKEAEPAKELEPAKEAEPEKPAKASETPVTNGENGCTNGDEHGTHNHHDDEREAEPSPMKKGKEEPKAQIISSSAPLSGESRRRRPGAAPRPAHAQTRGEGAASGGGADTESCGEGGEEENGERMVKRALREVAAAIVQDVMSAAAEQLEQGPRCHVMSRDVM